MKRKIMGLCKGMLAIGLMGACCISLIGGTGAAENNSGPKVTLAPDMGEINPELYINKKPSDEEIKAAADLKQVVQKWMEDGTYPDMFESCHLYGEYQERVVIVLTDVSEETKQEFLELAGVTPSQHWYFHETQFSRSELIAIKNEIEKEYMGDERIKCTKDRKKYIFLKDALTYEAPEGSSNYVIDQNLKRDSKNWGTKVTVGCEKEGDRLTLEAELEQKYGDAVGVTIWGVAAAPLKVTSAPARASGDVNLDGVTDLSDAQLALKAALGLVSLSDKAIQNGDINMSGEIELEDAQAILKIALSLA